MSDGERDLRTAVRDLAASLERGLGDHPAPEELLDFVAGDLSEAERERIEDHLALCHECARAALELAEPPEAEPAPAGELLTGTELAAEWQRFRGALAAARPERQGAATRRIPWALAAGLLLAVAGLTVWNARLREEARVLGGPRADVAVVDLVPQDAVARAEEVEEEVRPPAWADRLVLILNLANADSLPEYRLDMADAAGRVIWSRSGVRRGPDGTFTLELPLALVPPGSYRIRLSGRRGATFEPVAEYAVRFAPEQAVPR